MVGYKVPQEKTSNTEDGEEQLDFEAEEGECVEPKSKEHPNGIDDQIAEKGALIIFIFLASDYLL